MDLSALTAVSPIDGRYGSKTAALREIFSEYGLIKRRVLVEIRWLQCLAGHAGIDEVPALSPSAERALEAIVDDFGEVDARRIKDHTGTNEGHVLGRPNGRRIIVDDQEFQHGGSRFRLR